MKTCKTCGDSKPLDCFSLTGPKNRPKEYRKNTCRACWYETYYKPYVKAHKPQIREIVRRSQAKHAASNRDAINARRRERYAETIAQSRQYGRDKQRERRKAKPDETKANALRWRLANPEKQRAISRRAYERHPETFAESSRKRKLLKRGALGSHNRVEWLECVDAAGNRCKHCGVSGDEVKLTRDHIIPLTRGGTDFIDNIQPLCLSCNARKNNRLESELIYLQVAS